MKLSLLAGLVLCMVSSLEAVRAQAAPKNDAPGAYPCTFETTSKKAGKVQYSLMPLMSDKEDVTFTTKTTTGALISYWMNPCRQTITQVCGANSALCQQWDPGANGHASLGSTTTAKFVDGARPEQIDQGGFTVQFTDGTPAATNGQPRTMEVDFVCNLEAPTTTVPEFIGEESLHYSFRWETKYACPVVNGLSVGSIILIILASLIFVYFVGGLLFMKFAKKAEGLEIIPNLSFWSSLPGLIKDGGLYIGSKTCCRNQASAYNSV